MRVLVTGGAGFIGSHIVDRLLREGYQVMVVDNFTTGHETNLPSRIQHGRLSIELGGALEELLHRRRFHPDVICHQAGQSSLQSSIERPGYDLTVNAGAMMQVIEVAHVYEARVVFASTSAVYAPQPYRIGESYLPYTEESPIGPISPYGISKFAAECYLRASGVPHVILRYGNVYGPRQQVVGENQVVPHCLNHLFYNERFQIFGDGEARRDYVYVGDVVNANLLAITTEAGLNETFNIGKGWGISTNDLCQLLAEACGRKPDYTFDHAPPRVGELPFVALLSAKARELLGWTAATSLLDGIEQNVRWWRQGMSSL